MPHERYVDVAESRWFTRWQRLVVDILLVVVVCRTGAAEDVRVDEPPTTAGVDPARRSLRYRPDAGVGRRQRQVADDDVRGNVATRRRSHRRRRPSVRLTTEPTTVNDVHKPNRNV